MKYLLPLLFLFASCGVDVKVSGSADVGIRNDTRLLQRALEILEPLASTGFALLPGTADSECLVYWELDPTFCGITAGQAREALGFYKEIVR